ncbi:hypothetical protein [Ornithinimicrobium sufpigmenti]|uniref:hypothetical protein n=1 Tax=Ornithinimicrobium sufpigmenti TaxID=2508882 RepID=UPI0011AE1C11|nr:MULTISPECIES: hypothetical protein [unclassified Ornithinimicrobium]
MPVSMPSATPALAANSLTVRSQRESILRAARQAHGTETADLPEGAVLADLWSTDESWRDHLRQALATGGPVVLLSSLGIDGPGRHAAYAQVLADRERYARQAAPDAVVLRLAPVVEDLAVYEDALRAGLPIHHAYPAEPVAWLAARDAVAVAAAALRTGRTAAVLDVAGGQEVTVTRLLQEYARQLGATSPGLVPVPPEQLLARLQQVFGAASAAAVVGHQQWVGSLAGRTGRGAETVRRALGREPTDWATAVADLAMLR